MLQMNFVSDGRKTPHAKVITRKDVKMNSNKATYQP